MTQSDKPASFDSIDETKTEQHLPAIDNSFPEGEANELASIEAFNKHLYRPNTYLHKWWARRSGSTFRYILKQLALDPNKRGYYSPGGLEGLTILDPMMGGGTTIHEAIRLGANCVGFDIDPIPVLQAKASLKQDPIEDRKLIFNGFMESLLKQTGDIFETACPVCDISSEIQFTLYGLKRKCECREVVIVDSFTLRTDSDEAIHLCPNCAAVYMGLNHKCERPKSIVTLIERSEIECPSCHSKYKDILGLPFYKRYYPIAIVGQCKTYGQFYKSLDERDKQLMNKADELRAECNWFKDSDFIVPHGPKSDDLISRNVFSYLDLFSSRQLLYLHNSINLIKQINNENRLWLGLLISTSLEFNCLLSGYKGADLRRPGAIRHVFSHHAYSFPYTALENNPTCHTSTSGTLLRLFKDRIEKAANWAKTPVERTIKDGKLAQVKIPGEIDSAVLVESQQALKTGTHKAYIDQADSSAIKLPNKSIDYVVTDPPYFESVQYSNLSSFFRVWLRKLLPNDAKWDYDPETSAVAQDMDCGTFYSDTLARIWENSKAALKTPHGRLIFTFHHWKAQAWAELTISLMRSGFKLVNYYVVFSENPISVHINKLNALKHDCILVFQPHDLLNESPGKTWELPKSVLTSDSRQFCVNCANVLGYLLSTDVTEEEIRNIWQTSTEE